MQKRYRLGRLQIFNKHFGALVITLKMTLTTEPTAQIDPAESRYTLKAGNGLDQQCRESLGQFAGKIARN